jgi:hypothetical protein
MADARDVRDGLDAHAGDVVDGVTATPAQRREDLSMHAHAPLRRPNLTTTVAAVSLLAIVLVAIIALSAASDWPFSGSVSAPNVASRNAAPLAYWQPNMGEGLVGPALPAALRIAAPSSLGMGEGWVGGGFKSEHSLPAPVLKAHASCGQGEGLLQQGFPTINACGHARQR